MLPEAWGVSSRDIDPRNQGLDPVSDIIRVLVKIGLLVDLLDLGEDGHNLSDGCHRVIASDPTVETIVCSDWHVAERIDVYSVARARTVMEADV